MEHKQLIGLGVTLGLTAVSGAITSYRINNKMKDLEERTIQLRKDLTSTSAKCNMINEELVNSYGKLDISDKKMDLLTDKVKSLLDKLGEYGKEHSEETPPNQKVTEEFDDEKNEEEESVMPPGHELSEEALTYISKRSKNISKKSEVNKDSKEVGTSSLTTTLN